MSKWNNRYKKTWKEFGDRPAPPHVTFTEMWSNTPGMGKWYKRQLSKARRRYIKFTLLGIRVKEPTGWESEVNWKAW